MKPNEWYNPETGYTEIMTRETDMNNSKPALSDKEPTPIPPNCFEEAPTINCPTCGLQIKLNHDCPRGCGKTLAVHVLGRIQEYLGAGGLFNPEMLEHQKVRDLLLDCRTCIECHHDTIKWIASQQNLFFAECCQAEEIVTRCAALLKPKCTP